MAMTSRERIITALEGGQPDRVPSCAFLWDHSAIVANVSCADMRNDAHVCTKAYTAMYEKYRPDALLAHHDRLWQYGDWGPGTGGLEVEVAEYDQPSIMGQFWKAPEDAFTTSAPDPHSRKESPLFWRHVEHIDTLMDSIGDRAVVFAMHHGIFSVATLLRGATDFMLDLVESPEAAHKMMDTTTTVMLERLKVWIDHGVRFFMQGEPCPSCELISPKHFDEFALPYLQRLYAGARQYAMEKHGARFYSCLHICGNNTLILERMAEAKADCISLDQRVDLAVAKERVRGKVSIMGNIETTDALLLGTPEIVEEVTKTAIRKAGKGGGFIVAAGCAVPIPAPFRNVKAMHDACIKHGTYPLSV
jgi:uroporphyrinogen decarboxylase